MKKKRKAYSVDTMMRFFLQHYNIPTKQDVDKIVTRLDRLEAAIRGTMGAKRKKNGARKGTARSKLTATEKVVSVVKRHPKGIDVAGLKVKTGYEDKKIRNIVFRLCKQGVIKRVGRGVYSISS